MSRKRKIRIIAIVAGVVLLSAGAVLGVGQLKRPGKEIPSTRVRRGMVELNVYTTGELRPPKSMLISAPSVPGSLLLVHLTNAGSRVKAGDVICEFDPSAQEYMLEQAQSRLNEAQQQIIKARADMAVQAAQDKVALLRGRFDVRRAELEVQKHELVADIDKKKNLPALDEAKRRLAQLEKDVQSRAVSGEAGIAVLKQREAEQQISMVRAQQAIANMVVKSPIDGLVTVRENRDAMGGMYFWGMTMPDYREGDTVWPGRAIAEVLATDEMEVLGKIDEGDRSNITAGQTAEISVDGRPGVKFNAKVKAVAGIMTRRTRWGPDSGRRFDTTLTLEQVDPGVRPGVTASIVIRGNQLKDVLFLPRQCLFEKDGKQVVYARNGSGTFEPHEIKVNNRTESQIVVDGLDQGMEVALVNPEEQGKGPKPAAPAGPSMGGGAK